MPDLTELQMIYGELPRVQLSRAIQSAEHVSAMSIQELEDSLASHEAEITSLVGAIEGRRVRNLAGARQAERTLRLHKSWVERELKARRHARDVESAKLEKESRAQAHQQAVEKAKAEKMARIAASNDENMRQIAVFKEVALEALGAAKYLEFWSVARKRMAAGSPQERRE
jgi:hypothetical protein